MLKSDFGKVTIQGVKALLMAELGSLIYTLRHKTNLTDEEIKKVFSDAFMSDEEIDKQFEKNMSKERTTEEVQDLIR